MIVSKDVALASVRVKKAMETRVDLFARENFYDLVKKGSPESTVSVEILQKCVTAPILGTDALGKVIVTREGKVVAEIDLVTNLDVARLNYGAALRKVARSFKIT